MIKNDIKTASKQLNKLKLKIENSLCDINVIWCRYAYDEVKRFNNTEHHHCFYEIHCVTDGKARLMVNNCDYTVESGSFVIIPPKMRHRIIWQSNDFEKFVVGFELTLKETNPDFMYYSAIKGCIKRNQIYSSSEELTGCITRIIALCNKSNSGISSGISAYLQSFLFETALCILPSYSGNNEKNNCESDEIFWYEKVTGYIKDNMENDLSAEIIASQFHISSQQLNRILIRESSMTVSQIISQIRMKKVQELLKTTRLTLKDIAETVGISNEYNLNRFFKKNSGLTPGKYRESTRI